MGAKIPRYLVVREEGHDAVQDILLGLALKLENERRERVEGDLEERITRDELRKGAAQRPDVGWIAVLCSAPYGLWRTIPTRSHVMGEVALTQERVASTEFVRKHHGRA